MMNRQALMKIHALLAVFLLPVAIMFFVTGALYIWDIKGEEKKNMYDVNLNSFFSEELPDFVLLAENKLSLLGLPTPTGKPKIKKEGNKTVFEWPGSSVDIKVKISSESLVAQMEIKQAGWYRHLVQLHKAKGGLLFKIYATVLSIALLVILTTGFLMAWQMLKLRKLTVISIISGFLTFLFLAAYS